VWLDKDKLDPFDYWQYWYNTDDRDVGRFLRLFTYLPLERIAELQQLTGAGINEAKRVLANEATAICHGAEAAAKADEASRAMVQGTADDSMPTHVVEPGVQVVVALTDAGLAKSRGEARRLVQGGGVRLDNEKVSDVEAILEALPADGAVLRVGKKRAVRVVPV
jgi:tyrosyl-tRNA synthetase